jgi:hypothetical protein
MTAARVVVRSCSLDNYCSRNMLWLRGRQTIIFGQERFQAVHGHSYFSVAFNLLMRLFLLDKTTYKYLYAQQFFYGRQEEIAIHAKAILFQGLSVEDCLYCTMKAGVVRPLEVFQRLLPTVRTVPKAVSKLGSAE